MHKRARYWPASGYLLLGDDHDIDRDTERRKGVSKTNHLVQFAVHLSLDHEEVEIAVGVSTTARPRTEEQDTRRRSGGGGQPSTRILDHRLGQHPLYATAHDGPPPGLAVGDRQRVWVFLHGNAADDDAKAVRLPMTPQVMSRRRERAWDEVRTRPQIRRHARPLADGGESGLGAGHALAERRQVQEVSGVCAVQRLLRRGNERHYLDLGPTSKLSLSLKPRPHCVRTGLETHLPHQLSRAAIIDNQKMRHKPMVAANAYPLRLSLIDSRSRTWRNRS